MIAPIGRALGRAFAGYHRRAILLPRAQRVAMALTELLGRAGEHASILDVGCGDGAVAERVAAAIGARRVVGVELAPRGARATERGERRDAAPIAVEIYDGETLPFPTGSFDAVLLSDVLHHARDPERLLAECLRVARRSVAVKDHFAFGFVSDKLLLFMDAVGNADPDVEIPGRYLRPDAWVELVERCKGRITALRWPLVIHDLPWRAVTRSELQFAALVEHASGSKGDMEPSA